MDEARSNSILNHLKEAGIIAILRGQNPERMIQRGMDLANMGCTAIEVTLDSSNPLDIVRALRQQLPASVMIGVGTLLNTEQLTPSLNAGAEFALSPGNPEGVIQHSHAAGLLFVPGVSNPTELEVAVTGGVHIAKLFPSTEWTPEQLASVSLPWMPVGGVDAQSVWQWLDNGAWCVGMGANLCGSDLSDEGNESSTWPESEEQTARDIFMELQRRRNDA